MFAISGDVLRPKSFAGLFGAAPSVDLATLSMAFFKHGGDYVGIEGRSMVLGALALAAYSLVVRQLLMRAQWSAIKATGTALTVWIVMALGLKQLLIGQAMVVCFKWSALNQGTPYEYLLRFALGGLTTVLAGLFADWWGRSWWPDAGVLGHFLRKRHAY